ncbi:MULTISPECIES: response regulator [Sphingomonas]|jgi:CheY-like chemotaxis protein|uniref:Response regulator n=1 Tax=Sphingomonas glacialis TaxID=658225 RepID=A0ABQ3L8U4_9SPHN|nr:MULTISPECIES: response regulator [Sphingomonas]MDY7525676.1 response regulator [Sphingomonas sp. 10B4]MEB0282469.1 response regulator [Sphingomonas sp. 10B4]GHH08229.1 response regulator [Sphingomonas glacialis]
MSAQSILIVEDEPLIAMMIEDFLDVLGKSVAGSADTVEGAVAIIADGGVDAAILDVNLRGGEKSFPIAEVLAQKGIPFVFATGGSHDTVAEQFRDRPTLPKPFTMDGVSKALDALGTASAA